ncbi:hypothetical protein AAFF_G00017750 [Aldrovandia affinis]|uniref:THD domain-containing protein n=1 Tax=Aldrovandia affinis TaxID=143900 RepID=A0AAD7S5Q7_9TELE|nr:hypothetical protein AAFF_G00017750 [Aldrovandia affinis]
MSGVYKGLRARIQQVNPLADWIPCAAHSLNIVGMSSVDCCNEARFYESFIVDKLQAEVTLNNKRYVLVYLEFNRVVGKNLKQEFYEALDRHCPQIMEIFRVKRGLTGQLLADLLRQTKDVDDEDSYSHVPVGILCREQENVAQHPQCLHLNPSSVGMILEGKIVMDKLENLPQAMCLLFGLTYALHLNYPKCMKNTFFFIQQVLLNLEINQAQEEARVGEYPFHCLHQLVDPEYQESSSLSTGGLTSCDLWIHELRNSAHKQLLSDIRNSLYRELTASNITLSRSNKPVIHMGAEHGLRQFPNWLKKDGENNIIRTMDNLRWDNINGLAIQQGMMGYSPDGEIMVHHEGLYFVYSQVYFQLLPSVQEKHSQPFMQYIYRKTTSYQEPFLLSKAVMTKCWNAAPNLQLFSSHQGALFHLQQGDKLSLQVTDIQTVRLQEDSTFFGAFMIN